jgi:NADH dehydrogenase
LEHSVTVFGGTGFLGRHIVKRLVDESARVRVAVRRPECASLLGISGQIEHVHADVRDETSVANAVAGSDAVVNAVGLYVERGAETFDLVHVRGAGHVARQARRAGVERLIHISGIGADATSRSPYVRARAHGESAVEEAFDRVTVLRPSVLFGPGDSFFNVLARMARVMPVLPLFGGGLTKLQPVHVDDVARALVTALADPMSVGRVYELGGPKAYTYRALVELVLTQIGRGRMLLPVPFPIWEGVAGVMSLLSRPLVTRDQITLMKHDNVVGDGALSFKDLYLQPAAVEDVLPTYLG